MERKTTAILASVALLISLTSIWWRYGRATLKIDHAQFRYIGQVVATETTHSIKDQGTVVAVIDAGCEATGSTQFDYWQGFCNELKKQTAITLSATERVQSDPADGSGSMGCSSAAYKELLERHADASAIVFFVGLPNWPWLKQNALIPARKPAHILVVDTAPTNLGLYRDFFMNDYLSKLIAPRIAPSPPSEAEPKTPRQWFDRYFQIFTPQNYEALPE